MSQSPIPEKSPAEKARKSVPKRPHPFKDYALADRPGEQWRDVAGYEGVYEGLYVVSSHGRIKTVARLQERRDQAPVLVAEKVRRQQSPKISKGAKVALFANGHRQGHAVLRLVGAAFLPALAPGQLYYHRDKMDLLNNGVANILIGTVQDSSQANHRAPLVPRLNERGEPRRAGRGRYDAENNVLTKGVVTARVCRVCKREQPLSEFGVRAGGHRNRACRTCRSRQSGAQDAGVRTRQQAERQALADQGLRECSICEVPKRLEKDFTRDKRGYLGRYCACKTCLYKRRDARVDRVSAATQEASGQADDSASQVSQLGRPSMPLGGTYG